MPSNVTGLQAPVSSDTTSKSDLREGRSDTRRPEVGQSLTYIPALDSLRAVAISLVIVSHWKPANGWLMNLDYGSTGVSIFFVLSGFLISRILFSAKRNITTWQTCFVEIKNFYIRRALRIFPIYYLLVLICFVLSTNISKSVFFWFVGYGSNFYFAREGWKDFPSVLNVPLDLTHTWSLAVEEQFYLLWPILTFLTPARRLGIVITLFVLGGLGFHFYWRLLPGISALSHPELLTINQVDEFGWGALLALVSIYYPEKMQVVVNRRLIVMGSIAMIVIGVLTGSIYLTIPIGTLGLLFVFATAAADDQPFSNRLMVFVGKISYGMYIYHMLIWDILSARLKPAISFYPLFALSLISLLLLSYLSWRTIELAFNRLKTHFE